MNNEEKPYYIRDIEIVDRACSRWLQKRGLNYSFREAIRAGVRTTMNVHRKNALKEQREDDRVEVEFYEAD